MESLLEPTTRPVDLFSALWRRRYLAAAIFALIVLATIMSTAVSQKLYISEAKLQVQIGRDSIALDPTATIGPFVGVADSRETEIQAIEELMLSEPVLQRVVDEIGANNLIGDEKWYGSSQMAWLDGYNLNPFRVYDRRSKAIRAVRQDLSISIPKSSKIITVAYETSDPELATRLVQSLVKATVDEHLNVNHNKNSQEFFANEAKDQHDRLTKLEQEFAELKTSTGVASVEEQRRLKLEQISQLEDDLSRTSSRMFAAEAEIALRKEALAKLPTSVVTSEVSGSPNNPEDVMRTELFRLEIREKDLASRFSDDHEQLVQVRDQIRMAKAVVDGEDRKQQVTRGLNDARETYEATLREREAELVSLRAQVKHLAAEREAAQDHLRALNRNELKVKEYEREIALADGAYRRYKDSFEVTRIDDQRQNEKISNIRVLQEPTFSLQPSRPKYTLNAALGLMLASLASITVVVWSERRGEPAIRRLSESPELGGEPGRVVRRERESAVVPSR